jgi:LysM repeat protein
VRAGDTAFGIAQRFGIGLEDLVTANDLANANTLAVGQQLTIPAPSSISPTATTSAPGGRTYTVQAGDTLLSIAARFETTVEAIASANDLAPPYLIYLDQVLVIP